MKGIFLIIAFSVFEPSLVFAHNGRLDELGCHHDRKNGGYHCQKGPLNGQYFQNKEQAQAAYLAKEGTVPPARTNTGQFVRK